MKLHEVRIRLAEIAAKVDDDEVAHGREDALFRDLLAAIADGACEDPKACAKEALKSRDLDFARWCA